MGVRGSDVIQVMIYMLYGLQYICYIGYSIYVVYRLWYIGYIGYNIYVI